MTQPDALALFSRYARSLHSRQTTNAKTLLIRIDIKRPLTTNQCKILRNVPSDPSDAQLRRKSGGPGPPESEKRREPGPPQETPLFPSAAPRSPGDRRRRETTPVPSCSSRPRLKRSYKEHSEEIRYKEHHVPPTLPDNSSTL